jgi:hypothetical protein
MSPTSTDPHGIADLLATYDTAQRSTAALLCDDHDPERVAFTVIEETSAPPTSPTGS